LDNTKYDSTYNVLTKGGLEEITPRIILLPLDLLQFEILISQEPLSEKTLTEIVDDIFMPLVHP